MTRTGLLLACALGLSACATRFAVPMADQAATAHSGVLLAHFDPAVRPQDDFYRHVNGGWLATHTIPADKSNYGVFTQLADQAEQDLRELIEALAAREDSHGEDRQIGAMYRSFMDESRATALGLAPLQNLLDQIDSLQDRADLPALLARLERLGVSQPFASYIGQDAKDARRYTVYYHQFGQLGLPDRSYYLEDHPRFLIARGAYVDYLSALLRAAGTAEAEARQQAEAILRTETAVASAHWTRVDARDDEKTYHPIPVATLNTLTPDFDFAGFVRGSGVSIDTVIVMQPEAITAMADALTTLPMPVLRAFLKTRLIGSFAPYLGPELEAIDFAFSGKALRGIDEQRPRWKRGVALVEATLGEAVGQRYVAAHFPPEAKARMEQLVDHLIGAYRESIRELDWMSETTKLRALEKMDKFTPKIGYPDRWKSYAGLDVRDDDLVGNVMRSNTLEHNRQLAKLRKPVDRDEWFMTPQTVNAYYNPSLNEIVFPAAILQPPFFDLSAEDAVNFGAIGAVIGHEIGHGFDDQGSKYDGDGNLDSWWTDADRKAFEARTARLIAQYNGYCPLPEHCVNGALSIGENIGDLGGVSIALKAYRASLGDQPSPEIDGFSGTQRFFIGWAQVWARQHREEDMINRLKTGPHAPSEFRTNGVVRNIPDWYEAFDVGPDDALWLPPEERVRIW